jgi:hypothetical protein
VDARGRGERERMVLRMVVDELSKLLSEKKRLWCGCLDEGAEEVLDDDTDKVDEGERAAG